METRHTPPGGTKHSVGLRRKSDDFPTGGAPSDTEARTHDMSAVEVAIIGGSHAEVFESEVLV